MKINKRKWYIGIRKVLPDDDTTVIVLPSLGIFDTETAAYTRITQPSGYPGMRTVKGKTILERGYEVIE